MARKLRMEYPGAIYHAMNRGDHREPICQDDDDRREFLRTLAETCLKNTWAVHAWCLMCSKPGGKAPGLVREQRDIPARLGIPNDSEASRRVNASRNLVTDVQ